MLHEGMFSIRTLLLLAVFLEVLGENRGQHKLCSSLVKLKDSAILLASPELFPEQVS